MSGSSNTLYIKVAHQRQVWNPIESQAAAYASGFTKKFLHQHVVYTMFKRVQHEGRAIQCNLGVKYLHVVQRGPPLLQPCHVVWWSLHSQCSWHWDNNVTPSVLNFLLCNNTCCTSLSSRAAILSQSTPNQYFLHTHGRKHTETSVAAAMSNRNCNVAATGPPTSCARARSTSAVWPVQISKSEFMLLKELLRSSTASNRLSRSSFDHPACASTWKLISEVCISKDGIALTNPNPMPFSP